MDPARKARNDEAGPSTRPATAQAAARKPRKKPKTADNAALHGPVPQPYLAIAPKPVSSLSTNTIDQLAAAASSNLVLPSHFPRKALPRPRVDAPAIVVRPATAASNRRKYAAGLLSPPTIMPGGQSLAPRVQVVAPPPGAPRRRTGIGTAQPNVSSTAVNRRSSEDRLRVRASEDRLRDVATANPSLSSLGNLGRIMETDPADQSTEGAPESTPTPEPAAGPTRRRRRIVRGEGGGLVRRLTVTSREEGRALGLARGASMRRLNVWDDLPDPGDPPPAFPFSTTATNRLPPTFESSSGNVAAPPVPANGPAAPPYMPGPAQLARPAPPSPAPERPRSPPPNYDFAVSHSSHPPQIVLQVPSIPLTTIAASVSDQPDLPGHPSSNDAEASTPRSGPNMSSPTLTQYASAPSSPAHPALSPEGDSVLSPEGREDRRMWNADILAGYTLEERVRREMARREFSALISLVEPVVVGLSLLMEDRVAEHVERVAEHVEEVAEHVDGEGDDRSASPDWHSMDERLNEPLAADPTPGPATDESGEESGMGPALVEVESPVTDLTATVQERMATAVKPVRVGSAESEQARHIGRQEEISAVENSANRQPPQLGGPVAIPPIMQLEATARRPDEMATPLASQLRQDTSAAEIPVGPAPSVPEEAEAGRLSPVKEGSQNRFPDEARPTLSSTTTFAHSIPTTNRPQPTPITAVIQPVSVPAAVHPMPTAAIAQSASRAINTEAAAPPSDDVIVAAPAPERRLTRSKGIRRLSSGLTSPPANPRRLSRTIAEPPMQPLFSRPSQEATTSAPKVPLPTEIQAPAEPVTLEIAHGRPSPVIFNATSSRGMPTRNRFPSRGQLLRSRAESQPSVQKIAEVEAIDSVLPIHREAALRRRHLTLRRAVGLDRPASTPATIPETEPTVQGPLIDFTSTSPVLPPLPADLSSLASSTSDLWQLFEDRSSSPADFPVAESSAQGAAKAAVVQAIVRAITPPRDMVAGVASQSHTSAHSVRPASPPVITPPKRRTMPPPPPLDIGTSTDNTPTLISRSVSTGKRSVLTTATSPITPRPMTSHLLYGSPTPIAPSKAPGSSLRRPPPPPPIDSSQTAQLFSVDEERSCPPPQHERPSPPPFVSRPTHLSVDSSVTKSDTSSISERPRSISPLPPKSPPPLSRWFAKSRAGPVSRPRGPRPPPTPPFRRWSKVVSETIEEPTPKLVGERIPSGIDNVAHEIDLDRTPEMSVSEADTREHSSGPEMRGPVEYTDLDVLVSRLESSGREYEGFSQITSFLGPGKVPAATPAALSTLLAAPVIIDSRRTTAQGKVKLKLSFLGVRVTKCPICLAQFRDMEKAVMLPECGHSAHESCARRWFREDSKCFVCRVPLKESEGAV